MQVMIIYGVAVVRSVLVQQALDFGALFAIWVAVTAEHGSDAYWAATCSAALLFEFVFPPSLSVAGVAAVVAHSAIKSTFDAKHAGAIAIALGSLYNVTPQQWHLLKKAAP